MATPAVDGILHALIVALISPDNTLRSQAEKNLAGDFVDTRPEYTFEALLTILGVEPDPNNRSFIAVLLRRLALQSVRVASAENDDRFLPRIASFKSAFLNKFCTSLLQSLSTDTNHNTRKKIAYCVSDIAKNLIANGLLYPNLREFFFQCLATNHAEFSEIAFSILSSVPNFLYPNSNIDAKVVLDIFSPNLDVNQPVCLRLSALNACVSFISETFTSKSMVSNSSLLQALMIKVCNVLPPLFTANDEENLSTALTNLIELAIALPKAFRSICLQLFEFSTSVAQSKALQPPTRFLAIELMLSLLEEGKKMMIKNVPNFAERLFPICLEMMTQLDDSETAQWESVDDLDDIDNDDESEHIVGEQSLDRLSRGVGAKILNPILFNTIPSFVNSSDWRHRHAALLAICASAEGCYDQMKRHLGELLDAVVRAVHDPHPRVRHAMCNCLGQLCTDFSPQIQQKYHAIIIGALVHCLQNTGHPRVQAHGAAAIINFCEDIETRIIEVYLPKIFEHLVELLRNEKIYVQSSSIVTIAVLAEVCRNSFTSYAPRILPHLYNILSLPNEKHLRDIRGKAIDCATLVALCMKREVLGNGLQVLVDLLRKIQIEVTEPDDPQWRYLMQGWARVAEILGADFVPFLPVIMPALLTSAGSEPEFHFVQTEDELANFPTDEGWEITETNGTYTCFRTSVCEDREIALETIDNYANILGPHFAPYVANTFESIIPIINFEPNESTRCTAVSLVPALLKSLTTRLAEEEAGKVFAQIPETETVTAEMATKFWTRFLATITETLMEEEEYEFVHNALVSLQDSIYILEKNVQEQSVQTIAEFCHKLLIKYIEIARDSSADDDEDPNAEADFDDDLRNDNGELTAGQIQITISSVICSLLKVFGPEITRYFEPTMQTAAFCLREGRGALLRFGVQFFVDLIESLGGQALNYLNLFGERFVALLSHQSRSIAQNVVFAIGLSAQTGQGPSRDFCAAALPQIVAISNQHDPDNEDTVYVTENALSTLSKIIWYCSSAFTNDAQRNEALTLFIMKLPIVNDFCECVPAMEKLCDLVEGRHISIANNIEHVINVYITVLGNSILIENPEIEAKCAKCLVEMMGSITPDARLRVLSQISADQQASLNRLGLK